MGSIEFVVRAPDEMRNFGKRLAGGLSPGQVIYLSGGLGAGKTTLVGGVLGGLGHGGPVKSPTYTLLEPYLLSELNVYHFDLYRLADPGELETLALRDYLETDGVIFIEWPERGAGALPAADAHIRIETLGGDERRLVMTCFTELGAPLCRLFEK